MRLSHAVACAACLCACAASAFSAAAPPWDMAVLGKPPSYAPAPGFEEPGLRAIFYDGMPYRGKPTRVFAWYGAPPRDGDKKLPAMVLVHGGGGTAFADWVRLWNKRGYAAIAMDTCGGIPRRNPNNDKAWLHDEQGGPAGWGDFEHAAAPIEDQWPYHAVADAILAHSLIRSMPEVDSERVGLTGISWGGYLTCILAGVDSRFKFAAPVYGCGFLGENSAWLDAFARLPKEQSQRWLSLWDPSVYLPKAAMPMLWVTGTNDFAYPMDSLQKSYRLPTGPRTLAIRLRMPHGHGSAGEGPEEIHAFADNILNEGKPLAAIVAKGIDQGKLWVTCKSQTPIKSAELLYTKASGKWQDRLWEATPAELDPKTGKVSATVPDGATCFYLNLIDEQGRVTSCEHELTQ